ncbi:MAG TPA: ATP-binding protein [Treponemataceae bacterium]|nr:ATP-binding protein [Treponemataceae bacterium]
MNSLLTRTLTVAFIAIASFALVTALVVRVGFGAIVAETDRRNEATLAEFVALRLATLPPPPPEPSMAAAKAIAEALRDPPVKTDFIAVTDGEGRPIYWSRRERAMPPGMWHMISRQLTNAEWYTVGDTPRPRYRFAVRIVRVDAEASSVLVIDALKTMFVWGALVALAVAGVAAYLVSRPLSKQSKALASALAAMQGGRRDVDVPLGGTSEIREIAASAASLQDRLRQEESVRRQWSADIAHDLRTPLAVLKGQFEGLLDGVFDPDRARIEKNYREVLNLERLVNQLATLTRLETPGYALDCREMDASALCAEGVRRFSDAARARGLVIVLGAGADAPCPIRADSSLLERALANLVDNAIRHGDGDGEIRLSLARGQGSTVSFIVDNPGLIAPEDRPRVFDRMYRGDRSRNTQGSGIGLAVVLAIATAHGGTARLECDAAASRTRFILDIPGAPGAASSPPVDPSTEGAPRRDARPS